MQLRLVENLSSTSCEDYELMMVKFERPRVAPLGFFIFKVWILEFRADPLSAENLQNKP